MATVAVLQRVQMVRQSLQKFTGNWQPKCQLTVAANTRTSRFVVSDVTMMSQSCTRVRRIWLHARKNSPRPTTSTGKFYTYRFLKNKKEIKHCITIWSLSFADQTIADTADRAAPANRQMPVVRCIIHRQRLHHRFHVTAVTNG